MRLPRTKVGDILHVVLWDHSMAQDKECPYLLFEVFGRLVEETKVYYKIAIWSDPRGPDENSEYYGVVKGACKSVRVLK